MLIFIIGNIRKWTHLSPVVFQLVDPEISKSRQRRPIAGVPGNCVAQTGALDFRCLGLAHFKNITRSVEQVTTLYSRYTVDSNEITCKISNRDPMFANRVHN